MTPDEYLGRVRALAWQAADYLPVSRLEEVHRLIEHGEPAEGMCSLAWAIVGEGVMVPGQMIAAIREYTADMVEEEYMPANLSEFASADGAQ